MNRVREDLLHLSPEALAQTTNLGLVKRAIRELANGKPPTLNIDEQGRLSAVFADGIRVDWPAARAIQDSCCSCGAVGVCRHRIMAVLAYRDKSPPAPPPPPDQVDDATLAQIIPARRLALAEARRAAGLSIELRGPETGEPCPTARLPEATVRFWAGPAIAAARCDCVIGRACEHVALAVWAFRTVSTADGTALQRVQLGTPGPAVDIDATPYHALVENLLRHGLRRGPMRHARALTTAREAADRRDATWLLLLLAELETWLTAHAARSARFDPMVGVRLLAELTLRLAAGRQPGRAKTALGIGEARESELERLRLLSLGCRVDQEGDDCHARVVLADPNTGSRFVLDHHWQRSDTVDAARQRLAPGVQLGRLAGGQLLSHKAHRRADGYLTLARTRSTRNRLLPQNGDWSGLGAPLLFGRIAALHSEKLAKPLPQVLPRHAVDHFIVFPIGRIEQPFYDPDRQAVAAVLRDTDAAALIVRLTHRAHARHALDALAGALSGHFGPARHITGILDWHHGQPVLEPWAIACRRIVIPDLELACGTLPDLPIGSADISSNNEGLETIDALEELLAECLLSGLDDLRHDWINRAYTLVKRLRTWSLFVLANSLAALIDRLAAAAANPADQALAEPLLQLVALTALHREAGAVASKTVHHEVGDLRQ